MSLHTHFISYKIKLTVAIFVLSNAQAPQELVSLFNGSRQVVYGFVPHCKQVVLLYPLLNYPCFLFMYLQFQVKGYGLTYLSPQASLRAKIGNKEVKTMVSTSDLAMTQGKVTYLIWNEPFFHVELSLLDDKKTGRL